MNRTLATLLAASLLIACGDKGDEEEEDDEGSSGPCPEIDLGSDLGAPVHTGSTRGASDDYSFCRAEGDGDSGEAEGGGNDITFVWTAPSSDDFTVYTLGTEFDTMLTIRRESCSGAVLECDDDGGQDLDSAITVSASAGDRFVIVLDGYDRGDDGDYELNIVEGYPDFSGDSGDVGIESGTTASRADASMPTVQVTWTDRRVHVDIDGGPGGWQLGVVRPGYAAEDCAFGDTLADGTRAMGCHALSATGGALTYGGQQTDLQPGTTALTPTARRDATFLLSSDRDRSCYVWGADPAHYAGLGCTEL